jgi:hypothetical protein
MTVETPFFPTFDDAVAHYLPDYGDGAADHVRKRLDAMRIFLGEPRIGIGESAVVIDGRYHIETPHNSIRFPLP